MFGSDRRRAADLERMVEAEIQRHLTVTTEFFVRSPAEWKDVVARNPFPKEAERDPSHLVVMVFKDRPSASSTSWSGGEA